MVKNIQLKIIIIFMVLGVTIITALGCFYIYELKDIENKVGQYNFVGEEELKNSIIRN